jgi:hypothetical protein
MEQTSPESPQNIFEKLETTERPSETVKKEVVADVEALQNTVQIVDFFTDKFLKTVTQVLTKI